MDFGDSKPANSNKLIGIGLVIALHVFLVYALVTGLATSAVNLIKKPLEIKIVQAAPPPPPQPPPPPMPPPPPLTVPPPPYIPPPIVQVQQPVQQVFAVTTTTKPPAPTRMVQPTSVDVVCPNVADVAQALASQFQDISESSGVNEANVSVEFEVSNTGAVTNARIISSDFPGANALALQGVHMLACHGQATTTIVVAPFSFQSQ